MEYTLFVYKIDTITNLPHENCAASLGQNEVIVDDPLEEFPTFNQL